MVLKMVDFDKCHKSSQTFWNVPYTIGNVLGLVRNDFGWVLKGPKSADFEQKHWVIAHGVKMVDFGKCQKSSQTPWNVAYMLGNGFRTVLGLVLIRNDLGSILRGPKSADFEQEWTDMENR